MNSSFIIVSYDISDDRRRRKVMEAVEDFGTRVQYSVFECRLTPAQFRRLQARLRPLVREAEDSIRFYFINPADVNRIQILGNGRVTREQLFYIH